MVPNLSLPEGRIGHDIKFPGPEHGGFARIMTLKMKLCCLVKMRGPDETPFAGQMWPVGSRLGIPGI